MIKKTTSKQTIAIVVLTILLVLSIAFGATYSYFNGSSEGYISGNVVTATLDVALTGPDGQASSFSLHTEGSEVIPGQPLNNTALKVNNLSPVTTYMVVTFALGIQDNDTNVTTLDYIDAMDFRTNNGVVGDGWRKYSHLCNDGVSKIHTLVYLGNNNKGSTVSKGMGDGVFQARPSADADNESLVFDADCLRVPKSWTNDMQGKTFIVMFKAYVIQSTALSENYPDIVNDDVLVRTAGIAKAVINEFTLDTTSTSI
ncbi:MAG: hypothetical protein IJX26_00830 [Clostridia bacterium]|nr:hypothetical protein [Clostridia bacterium]